MSEGRILVSENQGNHIVKLEGDVRLTLCASFNEYIDTIFENEQADDLIVDLRDAKGVDSTTLGLLAKLAMYTTDHFKLKPTMFCMDPSLLQIIESMGLDDLYDIVESDPGELEESTELSAIQEDIEQIRKHILEAHKLLSLLNPANRTEFMDLIATLEEEEEEESDESKSL